VGSLAHTEPPEGIIHLSLAQMLPAAGGSRGRMEALMGHVLHTCRSFIPTGTRIGMQEWETGEPIARCLREGMYRNAVS
jgi:hypothetical protein